MSMTLCRVLKYFFVKPTKPKSIHFTMREDRNKSSYNQRVAAWLNGLKLREEMDRTTKNTDISAHRLVFQFRSSSDLSRGLADRDHK